MEIGMWDTEAKEGIETGKEFKRVSVGILHSVFPTGVKFKVHEAGLWKSRGQR